jgi:hypothetical protein
MTEVVSKLTSAEPTLFTAIVSVLFGRVRFPFPGSDTCT